MQKQKIDTIAATMKKEKPKVIWSLQNGNCRKVLVLLSSLPYVPTFSFTVDWNKNCSL